MGTQPPSPERGQNPLPNFGPFLLSPNGWMHQDATSYVCSTQPRGLCVRWRPSAPTQKAGEAPEIFDQYLLWLNGWIDQDATSYGGRPQSRQPCGVRWGPSSLHKKGAEPPPKFLAHFYCRQTAGCIKMPLGMDVGLSPGDFVLDGDPVPIPKNGAGPQIFGPCLLWPNG